MGNGAWIYWLGWLVVCGVFLSMFWLAWWALFADRPAGRRRCPKCWYDLTYSPGLSCAECGSVARGEHDLARTRRRLGVAALSIAVCVATVLVVNERMSRRGWPSLLPMRVLVTIWPLVGDESLTLDKEFARRISGRRLSDDEWNALLERCMRGDWGARPPSRDWARKYGRYITQRDRIIRRTDGLEWDPVIRDRLLELPPRIEATTRSTWPTDTPVLVRVRVNDWWPLDWEYRVTGTPLMDGAEPVTFIGTSGRNDSGFSVHLPPLDADARSVDLEIELQRRQVDSPSDWETMAAVSSTLRTCIDGTLDALIKPYEGEDLDEALRETFNLGVVKWTSGKSPVRVRYNPRTTHDPAFDGVSIGVRIELLHDGVRARQLDLWWLAGAGLDDRGYGWHAHREVDALLEIANDEDGRWTMRVTGDPRIALRAGDATRFWAGQFTVPMVVQEIERTAPPQNWRLEE